MKKRHGRMHKRVYVEGALLQQPSGERYLREVFHQ